MSTNCFVSIDVESTILGSGPQKVIVPLSRILKIVPLSDGSLNEIYLSNFNNTEHEVLRTKSSFADIFNSAMFVTPRLQYMDDTTTN